MKRGKKNDVLRNWWNSVFCTVCGTYDFCLFDKVGGKTMKKAMKFSDWCYKTLSDEETKMLDEQEAKD